MINNLISGSNKDSGQALDYEALNAPKELPPKPMSPGIPTTSKPGTPPPAMPPPQQIHSRKNVIFSQN